MEVNFSNAAFRDKAMELAGKRPESRLSVNGAFFLLIRGASPLQMENLIRRVQQEYPQCSGDEIYGYLQDPAGPLAGVINGANVLACAYDCLKRGLPLGNETVPGRKTNTSDWMGHCLFEAKLCGQLAGRLGLDPAKAMKMGMLHDLGRRVTHTFLHTVRGFELLVEEGYDAEALACLTHSFIDGGRCASNETAEEGFYVSEEGMPCFLPDAPKDEITRFLEVYEYTEYDRILNLADLMATSKGIVSPLERIQDIATRRTLDPVNRGYFLAELINLLNRFLPAYLPEVQETAEPVRFTKDRTIREMEQIFEQASDRFWNAYLAAE